MNNRKGRIFFNLLALLLSFALLTTTTLAYFTDRVAETITGKAGSLSIALAAPERGKKVFSYDTMNDFSLTITNDGNKSMDVRVLAAVSSNMPIEEGFSFEELEEIVKSMAETAFEAGEYLTNDEVFHHTKEAVSV